jgi:membrane protease YdiL (CAAX protease family)
MGQDGEIVPRMDNPVDSRASLDDPSAGSAGMPPQVPPPKRSVFRDVPWRWSDVLIGLAPFLLLRAASSWLGPRSPLAASGHLVLPMTLVGQIWMLVIPLWIARRRTTFSVGLPRPRVVLVEALFALLALPVMFAASIAVYEVVANRFPGTGSPTMPWAPAAGSFDRIEWLAFVVMAVTLGPVAEEMFYRGLFYNALRQRLHPILAATIQGAVFGYEHHPFGLASSAGIGMAGLLLALVYEWRKTLLAPILVHSAMNAVGMVLLTLSLAADAAAPRLGVLGEAHSGGCRITEVVPGSAANAAGLQVGDVITAVDGEPVADIPGVAQVILKHQIGDTVSIEFLRTGTVHRADAVLVRLRR